MKNVFKVLSLVCAVMNLSAASAVASPVVCGDPAKLPASEIPHDTEIKFLKRFDFLRHENMVYFETEKLGCSIHMKQSSLHPRFIKAGRTTSVFESSAWHAQTVDIEMVDKNIKKISCTRKELNINVLSAAELIKELESVVKFDVTFAPCDEPVEANLNNGAGNGDYQASSVR